MTKTFCDRCGDRTGGIDHCEIQRDVFGEDHPEHGGPYKRRLHVDLCIWCLQCVADELLARLSDAEAEEFFNGMNHTKTDGHDAGRARQILTEKS